MSREKQIEEMEKLQDRLIKRSCTEYNTVTSMYLVEAAKAIGTLLEGYRKQSEGELKNIFQFGDECWLGWCSKCGKEHKGRTKIALILEHKYCSECGAKMKGGAE